MVLSSNKTHYLSSEAAGICGIDTISFLKHCARTSTELLAEVILSVKQGPCDDPTGWDVLYHGFHKVCSDKLNAALKEKSVVVPVSYKGKNTEDMHFEGVSNTPLEKLRISSLSLQYLWRELNPNFTHTKDYTEVSLRGETYQLSDSQAKIVMCLHQKALVSSDWHLIKTVMYDSGLANSNFKAIFKNKKISAELIQRKHKDTRHIRLNLFA